VADARFSLTALLVDERRASDLADWRLREAVSRVRARHPGLELTTHRLSDRDLGWPDAQTAALSGAGLLVVGARGRHAEPAFGLGTVSRHLLKSTACPVLVVPERVPDPAARPGADAPLVVAGVDEGALAVPVLRAALDEAALRGTGVLAVHSFAARPDESHDEALARARTRTERLVLEVRDTSDAPAGVDIRTVVTDEAAAQALVARGRGAAVLVLGTRGPAALAGLSMDSVSRAVLDVAPCPVLLLVPRVARTVPAAPLPHQRHRSGT
jgi:nucleotide-binding universal stress UspA family protein